MIRFTDVGFSYDTDPVFAGLSRTLDPGQLVLVTGPTGAGKSTLLATINGLAPHFTGGQLSGQVSVAGRSTRDNRPRDLAHLVGYVGQNPAHGFVTAHVESELAFGMEQQGIAPAVMRRRVEEVLDLMGLADLRGRALGTLSLGQQQRVALGAVLTAHPQVLVLDEPTSALDPVGAEEVLATLTRLVDDLGLTIVLAEHRLERVLHHADLVLHLPGDGTVLTGDPAAVLSGTPVAPPLLRLADALGWEPAPLTVRAARALVRAKAPWKAPWTNAPTDPPTDLPTRTRADASPVLTVSGLRVRYGTHDAVRGIDLTLQPGEITALMGRNGSGKSSLLWALQGSGARSAGTVEVSGQDPARLPPAQARSRVGLIPQDVTSLFYCETVVDECAAADQDAQVGAGSTRALLDDLVPDIANETHPRDLSEGQRLALALAVLLATPAEVLLLDEPTRGLDYAAKAALVVALGRLAASGTAILVATHDVELAADLVHRVVLLADGEIIADGPARSILTGSPSFAPQVAKVFAPRPWIRLTDVPTPEPDRS